MIAKGFIIASRYKHSYDSVFQWVGARILYNSPEEAQSEIEKKPEIEHIYYEFKVEPTEIDLRGVEEIVYE